jgi:hypothetical protein
MTKTSGAITENIQDKTDKAAEVESGGWRKVFEITGGKAGPHYSALSLAHPTARQS